MLLAVNCVLHKSEMFFFVESSPVWTRHGNVDCLISSIIIRSNYVSHDTLLVAGPIYCSIATCFIYGITTDRHTTWLGISYVIHVSGWL